MKISILTCDLSHNCLGRAYLLAKILQRHYQVEIVGPIFGDGIWGPVAEDTSITYKSVKAGGLVKPFGKLLQLVRYIEGDVLYVSKPLMSSYGVGLLARLLRKRPLLLDIDDWQMGLMQQLYNNVSFVRGVKVIFASLLLYRVGSYYNNLICHRLIPLADEITVSNHFLQQKFGGTIIEHGRDTDAFNPQKFSVSQMREKYGIEPARKVILFFGTPRPHKGIGDLLAATNSLRDPGVLLALVGIDEKDSYSAACVKTAKKLLGNRVVVLGEQPFENIPEIVSLADIVVMPQRKDLYTVGQMPAKAYDAMSMAKPIIATDVSDLRETLEGCGWVVEAGNLPALTRAMQYALDNSPEASEMGQKARLRCIERYSWNALEKKLVAIFRKYERKVS